MAKDVVVREIIVGQIIFIVTLMIVSLLAGSCYGQFGVGNFFPAAAPPLPTNNIPNSFSPPNVPFAFSSPPPSNLGSPLAPSTGVAAPGGQPTTSFPTPPPQQSDNVNPPTTPINVFSPPPMTPTFTFPTPPPPPPSTAFPFTPPTPNFFAPPPTSPTNNAFSPPPTPSNSFPSPIFPPPTPTPANPPTPTTPPAPAIGPGSAPGNSPAITAPPAGAPVSLSAPPVSGPAIGLGPAPAPVSLSAPPLPAPASPPPAPAPVSPPPAPTQTATYMIVDPFGYGEYATVQSAIEAVPVDNSSPVIIELLAGTYTEKLTIPATKPYITLQGAGMDMTIITHNDTANVTGSTSSSATISVHAAHFTARNITFQNSAPTATPGEIGAQAVAMRIVGDMAAFYGCGFVSSQDTLLDELGRHYFSDCYIVGNIDIIWGNGQSLYQSCEIQSIASNGGSLTAQGRTSEDQATGFSFVGGSITGTGNNLLGRAYGMYSRVVFIDTYMEDIITGAGWSTWPQSTSSTLNRRLLADNANTTTVFYGEYGNTGPGANSTKRVSWEKQLTAEEVTSFMDISFIDGSSWLTSA